MKLRAFVVMPFRNKRATDDSGRSIEIDFNRVYDELIEPALKEAGCEPFRADCDASSGDIRTAMFFELVTADVVVADLSVPNANVYYELGIRDGVCPRGVFIIQGGFTANRPFDIASDRSFIYPGSLFEVAAPANNSKAGDNAIAVARLKLAQDFEEALALDEQSTGSPLYAHLPGLKPVNWEGIETSKALYFRTLQHNWEEKVRKAQDQQRPGNIITLAEDAPTRMHRKKILWHAARSLIGLCRFRAAEDVLREVLRLAPDDLEAHHQLAVVLANLNDLESAQSQLSQMNEILRQQPDADVGLDQGLVYRVKWYLQWTNDPNPRQRAISDSRLLMLSIESFHRTQRRHPEQYLSGYNALLLIAVVEDLFPGVKPGPPLVDIEELTTVVRYTATAAREAAEGTPDYDTLFWSAVCLAGLEMIKGNQAGAMQWGRAACDVPSATLFYLQSLQQRLLFLEKLQFRQAIVNDLQKLVEQRLSPAAKWGKVIVFHGYELGESARFPLSSLAGVERKIQQRLEAWGVGPGDLAICAGATAGDVMFGNKCLDLGAQVRLLMADANADELVAVFLDPISIDWTQRAYAMAERPAVEVWQHAEELGMPVEPSQMRGRNNRWILNTARMEAENGSGKTHLYGLFLWDETMRVDDPEDPSFFIAGIRKSHAFKGGIAVIDPSREAEARGVGN